jgi:hypothetical protein
VGLDDYLDVLLDVEDLYSFALFFGITKVFPVISSFYFVRLATDVP